MWLPINYNIFASREVNIALKIVCIADSAIHAILMLLKYQNEYAAMCMISKCY